MDSLYIFLILFGVAILMTALITIALKKATVKTSTIVLEEMDYFIQLKKAFASGAYYGLGTTDDSFDTWIKDNYPKLVKYLD